MTGVILGIDIGSSHIKLTTIDLKDFNLNCKSYPVLHVARRSGVSRLEIIRGILSEIFLRYNNRYDDVNVNIVTSLEAAKPNFDFLKFFIDIREKYEGINFYTLDKNLSVQSLDSLDSWPYMSSIHSIRYIGGKLLESGILVHMNSSSSVFAPVLNGKPVDLPLHYSSGIALWKGALYTLLQNISTNTIVFGRQSPLSSPDFVSILDVLTELNKLSSEDLDIIEKYTSRIEVDESKSIEKLMMAIGCFRDFPYTNLYTGTDYDILNQVKLSSLYMYQKYLFMIFENVIKILSEVDIPWENMELIISGIGKNHILKDAFHLFGDKVVDIESYIPIPYSIFLESFGSAISLLESTVGTSCDLKNRDCYLKW